MQSAIKTVETQAGSKPENLTRLLQTIFFVSNNFFAAMLGRELLKNQRSR
jgi:hypothetical protein